VAAIAPRWNRLEHDERRSQILAAAAKLFSERHYASVSTKDIADAAGVARGLLHHYFGSKRDLYLEVAREMLRVPTLPLLVDADASREEIWASSVDGWLDLMEANRETWLTATRAGETGDDPQLREILDEASEVVVERVLEALGLARDDAPPELRAVVRSYGGLAQEATREWLERGRLDRAQVRILLVGVMPLIARELLPDIVREGQKVDRSGR
jgi:AcrR family transcriptional regulator